MPPASSSPPSDRGADWWNRVLGRDGYPPSEELPRTWLVHEGEDGPDGLLAWSPTRDFGLIPPLGGAGVWNLTSATDAAYQGLWAYLTGLAVIDEDVSRFASGRYRLSAHGDDVACTRSDDAADVEITQQA